MDTSFSIKNRLVLRFCVLMLVAYDVQVETLELNDRLRILEQRFAVSVYDLAVLQQRTQLVEDRLSNLTKDSACECAVEDPSKQDISEDKADKRFSDKVGELLKAFKAEKVLRHRLEAKCNKMTEIVEVYKESQKIERKLMDDKIDSLTQEIERLNDVIKENNLGKALSDLNKLIITAKHELNQRLQEEQQGVAREIVDLKQLVTSNLETFNQKLERTIENAASNADIDQLLNHANISFSARLGSSVKHLKPDATLIFDRIITNNGNGYSASTGVFTAPVDGTYVFYVHILAADRSLEMNLNKNDQRVMWLYINGRGHGGDSNMIVLVLKKGDRINVVKHSHFGQPPFYVHYAWSTFSGFLIP